MIRVFAVCLLACLLQSSVGCKKSGEPQLAGDELRRSNDLKQISIAYASAIDEYGSPPTEPMLLHQFIFNEIPIDMDRYVINWGVDIRDIGDLPNSILAYEKDAPSKGGFVAFFDLSGRRVSADEFKNFKQPTPVKMNDRPADFSMSANSYGEEVNKNSNAAMQKYRLKVVELKGFVRGFESSSRFKPPKSFFVDRILVVDGQAGNELACFVTDVEPWKVYAKGQPITIKGRAPHPQYFPHLQGCVVMDAGASGGLATTAPTLAREFAADADAAQKKYSDKSIIVTGDIIRAEKELFWIKLTLKGDNERSIVCKFKGNGRETLIEFKPDDKVKLYAEFERSDKAVIEFEKCQLIGE